MRRLFLLAVILAGAASAATTPQYYPSTGWCERGGVQAVVPSLGTAKVNPYIQASYPNCTIEVLNPDLSDAVIYSDSTGTPLSNPFHASGVGLYTFYALPGNYPTTFSGSAMPTPFSRIISIAPTSIPNIVGEPDQLPANYLFTIPASGVLTGGVAASVTLPVGLPGFYTIDGGANHPHGMWLSQGTGMAEVVNITSTTCNPGVLNCRINFIPANNHIGNWTLTSTLDGIPEAYNYTYVNGGRVHVLAGTYSGHSDSTHPALYMDLTQNHGFNIFGDGYGYYNLTWAAIINNVGTGPLIQIVGSSVTTGCEVTALLSQVLLHGSSVSGEGIRAANACPLKIDHLFQVESATTGFYCTPNCFGVRVENSFFYSDGAAGAHFETNTNAISVEKTGFQNNCRQQPGVPCFGLEFVGPGLQVTVRDDSFALNGMQPIGGFPSKSGGVSFSGMTGITYQGNECEVELTHCMTADSTTTGFSVLGNAFLNRGLNLVGTQHGVIEGNSFISEPTVATITAIANSSGSCQYTVSAPPTLPFTQDQFVHITGVTGTVLCNGFSKILSVQSTTQFTAGLIFSGSYVSGGTVNRPSGYFASAPNGTTYTDIHIRGNDTTVAPGAMTLGGDLLPGTGPTMSSAGGVLNPSNVQAHVTGASTVHTMTPPSGFGGQFCALSDGGFLVDTADNFAAAATTTAGKSYCWQYDVTGDQKWH